MPVRSKVSLKIHEEHKLSRSRYCQCNSVDAYQMETSIHCTWASHFKRQKNLVTVCGIVLLDVLITIYLKLKPLY